MKENERWDQSKKNRICPFYRDNLRINENPREKKEHKVSSNSAVRIYLCVTTSRPDFCDPSSFKYS